MKSTFLLTMFVSCLVIAQTNPRKRLPVNCYWDNITAQANYTIANEWLSSKNPEEKSRGGKLLNNLYGCDEYQDPTHCDRTGMEMTMDKRHWARVTAEGSIYTIVCRKCKRTLSSGSYDVETDGKEMWITFEMPDKRNVVEKFDVIDVSPMKVQ
jgi:hypothetical protein